VVETISWQDKDGARWIALEGEMDHEGCAAIRERFDKAVADGTGDVIVAVDGVTFLASMGVGMLLKARETLAKKGRKLKLTGVRTPVRRALELMNLLKVFEQV
jgi:anti-anti-sigma factor